MKGANGHILVFQIQNPSAHLIWTNRSHERVYLGRTDPTWHQERTWWGLFITWQASIWIRTQRLSPNQFNYRSSYITPFVPSAQFKKPKPSIFLSPPPIAVPFNLSFPLPPISTGMSSHPRWNGSVLSDPSFLSSRPFFSNIHRHSPSGDIRWHADPIILFIICVF